MKKSQYAHTFESGGTQYGVDEHGVIHQLDANPFAYDTNYIGTYHTDAYKLNAKVLSGIRFGWICGALGLVPDRVFDFGYGDGSFLEFCKPVVKECIGFDISGTSVPAGCTQSADRLPSEPVDVYTCWDALEHSPDLSWVKDIEAQILAISLPHCHFEPLSHKSVDGVRIGPDWFEGWKHRKPDEHLHHFSPTALVHFMQEHGWYLVCMGNPEDLIRKPVDHLQNILSACFTREKKGGRK